MRTIEKSAVIDAVKKTLIEANYALDETLVSFLRRAKEKETNDLSRSILEDILANEAYAREGHAPLCQDTGVVVAFAEVGYGLALDFDLYEAINDGVRKAYDEGYLRKSVVKHPFQRENTRDNTPAIVHTKLVPGDKLTLKLATKGAGSENMSKVVMLTPADGIEGVKKLVLDTIFSAGGKPCPPIIVGIGLGGNFEKSAILAKEAILRNLEDESPDPDIRALERELLHEINRLGIGPMGVGGDTTCLAVKINTYPMHIASLPVAINIQCHSARHLEVVL